MFFFFLHSSAWPISFSLIHFSSFQVIQRTSSNSSSCSENCTIKLKQIAKSSRQLVLMGKSSVLWSLFCYLCLYFVWHNNWIKQIILLGKRIGRTVDGCLCHRLWSYLLFQRAPSPPFLCNPKKLCHCTDKHCRVQQGTKCSNLVWPIILLLAHAFGRWDTWEGGECRDSTRFFVTS